jgi:chromosome segregation ATPase
MPRKDTLEQGEESLVERLDALQATNASKFGDINATLQRLDDHILANDNHLFTTNAKIEDSTARLNARLADSHTTLNERIEDSSAMLNARMKESQAAHATLTARLEQFMSSFDNSA